MGNFEKLVVLTVLFLSAIVLAVSMSGDDEPEQSGPMDAAAKLVGDEEGAPAVPEERPEAPENDPVSAGRGGIERPGTGVLLDAGVQPAESSRAASEASRTAPVSSSGTPSILVSTAGLEPAGIEGYMVYEIEPGDTWIELSRRFYGNTRYVGNLHADNEDMETLIAGEKILVPAFDFTTEAGRREAFRPVEQPVGSETGATADPAAVTSYVIQPGDNLSKISNKVYGTPHRWEEIYAANKDVLESPDWLDVGTKLRIPRD